MSEFSIYESSHFDYLFIGAGASSSLLLMAMHQRGLLNGMRIAILEPDAKQLNDKTYCFWATESDPISTLCSSLIKYQWPLVRINQSQPQSIDPLRYMQVSSLDLYNVTRSLFAQYNIVSSKQTVISLASTEGSTTVITDRQSWQATQVFDSRPPKYASPKQIESHLLQSFIGYVVELENPIIDPTCIDLMDFNIDQQSSTQFVYVLPYANNNMLAELTRFDEKPICELEAKPLLDAYIRKRFGSYQLKEIEIGCIPMSNADLQVEPMPGVVVLGARAGAIKPSTGYGFKNMALHAIHICEALEKQTSIPSITKKSRFQFYDRLLLYILRTEPTSGKPIFDALFKHNDAKKVLTFLEEKTTPMQELKLLLSLPKRPFITALLYDQITALRRYATPLVALGFSLLFWWIHLFFPTQLHTMMPMLFAIGLIAVGIPHGALDHLLERDKFNQRIEWQFVVKYVGAALLYGLIWMMNASLALVVFLLYSIWHFGQTDMEQWKLNQAKILKSWIWGALLFGILLVGHLQESIAVLQNLNIPIIQYPDESGRFMAFIFVGLAGIWSITERSFAMLLSVMMLAVGIQLPLTCAFGLYFIGQHSMHGWSHLKRGLLMNSKSLYMKALPFTLGAIALFLGAYLYSKSNSMNPSQIKWEMVFYVFISCISFPHVVAMSHFYKKNREPFH